MPDWLTRREVRAQPESQSPLEALLAKVDARVDRLTDRYFRAMGEHIKDLGKLPPSDVHRLEQLRRMNRSLSSILRGIAAASKLDEAEILQAFRETAEEDARMAASVLNVSPERAREIPRLERIVRAQARETAGAMKNLSNTTVASEGYRKLVDSAVTAVQSGVEDYGSAIRHAIREAGGSGLRVKYESGETRRLDTAIRMNILDGVRHLTQQVLTEVGREFGADGVEIDAHMLCAEDHLPYQGCQFSNDEFEEIQSSLARPFGEWNCHHVWHPILLGVSAPAYTEAEREEMRRYSTEEVEIDGRTKTRYEWSQEMRRCETAVRSAKDTANLAREAGDDELRRQCQRRINALNDHYTHLSSTAGLKPEYTRTYVGGFVDARATNDLTGVGNNDKMMVSTGGRRNEAPLTEAQRAECISIAKEYGMPIERIVFADDMLTGYFPLGDRLYIGTDVYPSGNTEKANYMISCRGALAHELVGHRNAFLKKKTQAEDYLEEVQASLRASKAQGLTEEERKILVEDARERLPEGITLDDIIQRLFLEV